jgi:hypothetical protein
MDRTPLASHAGHDELLIARLYGDDVTERERTRALELVADCRDCADLFADLGAIAEAQAELPIPTRPRDFMLTEVDAARLKPRRRSRMAIFGLGLRRSLGGSLAALGLAGLVLTGATSLLSQTATSDGLFSGNGERLAATDAQNVAAQGQAGAAVASAASTAAPVPAIPAPATDAAMAVPAGSSPGSHSGDGSLVVPLASGQTKHASPGTVTAGGSGQDGIPVGESTSSGGTGFDARLVWIVGFGLLFAIGLALAVLPGRPRWRARAR